MREEKQFKPSPNNKKGWQKKPWFWPTIYAGIAVVLIVLIFSFDALFNDNKDKEVANDASSKDSTVIETNARTETLKYPFSEKKLESVEVVQDFYDLTADEETREKSLLVFNQVFSTSTGVSLSINNEPFEVLSAMSGEVKEVKNDPFTGNQIVISHPNGMETHYSSVSDILVKEGDKVEQGQALGKTIDNESNPSAGNHLHFEVLEDGKYVNPREFLSF